MAKTDIEYLTDCWNFYPGCNHWRTGICPLPNCWAHSRACRFNKGNFTPHLVPEKLLEPIKGYNPKKPRRIGVCYTGDLFGDWVDPNMTNLGNGARIPKGMTLKKHLFILIESCPRDTFVFSTKRPGNLVKWSPFSKNCWVGVSASDVPMFANGCDALATVNTSVRFVSLEPLLDFESIEHGLIEEYLASCGINWLIIGLQTPIRKGTMPKLAWIYEIVQAADRANIPVFLKSKLLPIINVPDVLGMNYRLTYYDEEAGYHKLRQEFPVLKEE